MQTPPINYIEHMAARDRGPKPLHIASGVVTTFLLHALVVLGFVFSSMLGGGEQPEEAVEYNVVFDDVELLALGEEKPPEDLPRIANPAPPPKEDAINIARPDKPQDKPQDEPRPRPDVDRAKLERERQQERERAEQDARQRRMADALSSLHNPNRPTNTDTPRGSEHGVAQGTISDAALANLMRTYQARLLAELLRNWELPSTISEAEIRALAGQVWVYVRIAETGNIVSYTFRKRSNNEQFDASIERVLKRFQVNFGGRQLPLPDEPNVRREVLSRGLELKNWENLGR